MTVLKAFYAWRYRRYWLRWRGDPRGPFQPNPFLPDEISYPIAKAIREENSRDDRG